MPFLSRGDILPLYFRGDILLSQLHKKIMLIQNPYQRSFRHRDPPQAEWRSHEIKCLY
jgi:hypothetical protein